MESSGNRPRPPVQQSSRPATSATSATPPKPVLPTKAITPETDLLTTAATTVQWAKTVGAEKRPYWKLAFANPYNLSLLTGGIAASVLTLNPLLALATLGLEGLWMLHAPESSLLRRAFWDPQVDKLQREAEERARNARLAYLSPEARQRVMELVAGQAEIRRLAAQNPSFAGEMLRGELDKTDRLVAAFIDLSITCARYEQYLGSVDERRLAADKRRIEQSLGAGAPAAANAAHAPGTANAANTAAPQDDQPTSIARKNLAILNKRIEKITEIHRYLEVARGQLDLISNSFQLIADQIVTMQSPQELSGQLDELLDGVETVKQTAADTERLLATIER
jgi:hypothetical protein